MMVVERAAMLADPEACVVYDYATADTLDGSPDEELVRASLDAIGGTGAVVAIRTADGWRHVPDSDEAAARARGDEPRTVYVMAD